MKRYVRFAEGLSQVFGNVAMWLALPLMGMLVYEVIARTFFNTPHIWQVEMCEFTMGAYYMLGGAYTLMHEQGHVRMDVFYERRTERGKAVSDVITFIPIMLFYLLIWLNGSISSLEYALVHHQKNFSSWGPPLAPIKIVIVVGLAVIILQAAAECLKKLQIIRGGETK